MRYNDIQSILGKITYKDSWRVDCIYVDYTTWALRAAFTAPDMITGIPAEHHGRLYVIPSDADENVIVTTAFAAIKAAEEHETLEFFKYEGVSIFNPHIKVRDHMIAFARTFASCLEDEPITHE